MRRSIWLLGAATVAAACMILAPSSSAHIRYSCSTAYNPTGWCTLFNGDTVDSYGTSRIDPINIIWYPYGGWNPYWTGGEVHYILYWEFQWKDGCGSNQWNIHDGQLFIQNGQQGSSWCPNTRYHMRVFEGHFHYPDACCSGHLRSSYYDWSVSDAHHEAWPYHNIDRDWDSVENYVVQFACCYGYLHSTDSYWQYLPRGQGTIQGYYSDGWASRISAYVIY